MNMNPILVPLGVDCSVTYHLRKNGKRFSAYPFDWNVTPINSAISLIQNGFVDFMKEENLVYLPSVQRRLFAENGVNLRVTNEIITPVICKKYNILFPHDFSKNAEEDFLKVKEKYERRMKWTPKTEQLERPVKF